MSATPIKPARALIRVTVLNSSGQITGIEVDDFVLEDPSNTTLPPVGESKIIIDLALPDEESPVTYAQRWLDPNSGSPADAGGPEDPSGPTRAGVLRPTEQPSPGVDEDDSGPSSGGSNDSVLERLQILVAKWALAFLSFVIGVAVVRWALTPDVDVASYLRSGVLSPVVVVVGAVVAWSFKSGSTNRSKKKSNKRAR